VGLRLADVTEMPTRASAGTYPMMPGQSNPRWATLGVRRVRGKHFFVVTTR
jgi:hypothetical protein